MNENKESIREKVSRLVAGGIFFLIFATIIIGGVDKAIDVIFERNDEKVPLILFSQEVITEDSVLGAIKNLDGLKENITKIKTDFTTPGIPYFKAIDIYYHSDIASVEMAVHIAIKVMEVLFEIPGVVRVTMRQESNFIGKNGIIFTELTVEIVMDKEVADKIVNWEAISNAAQADYNIFFNFAELQFVHPVMR